MSGADGQSPKHVAIVSAPSKDLCRLLRGLWTGDGGVLMQSVDGCAQ